MESHDAPGVHVRQEEHVQVEHGVEHQGGAEEGHEAYDDGVVGVVHDEEDAGGDAGQPHHHDDGDGALRGHDAVVAQRVKDGDVAIRGDGAQKGERGHHGAADHHVDDVVQKAQHAGVHVHQAVVVEEHEYGLHHVADADQDVGDGQAADEVVHGRVQVAVLDDGEDHQDVLHQADEPQGQEELLGDADLHAAQRVLLSGGEVRLVLVHEVIQGEVHVEDGGVGQGRVAQRHALFILWDGWLTMKRKKKKQTKQKNNKQTKNDPMKIKRVAWEDAQSFNPSTHPKTVRYLTTPPWTVITL